MTIEKEWRFYQNKIKLRKSGDTIENRRSELTRYGIEN